MGTAKVAITIDAKVLSKVDRLVKSGVFPNRSRAIQEAVTGHLSRLDRGRLAREAAKLTPKAEAALADEGLGQDLAEWPEY